MIDVSKIEKLMNLMAKHGFDVVQAESSAEKISLARNVGQTSLFQPQAYAAPSVAKVASPAHAPQVNLENIASAENMNENPSAIVKTEDKNEPKKLPEGITITSPFVGTFYRSPGPDAPVFAELGAKIKKGQSLCIVEAMKLMNEIEAEIDGEIVAILVDNAKPVEFGTPLFIVAPSK
ncbi:acetyl-CoA carboxylase biotin carboxyl carrier protein [Fluviispira vulneris]|uniref:acetyl-CoA carboxylase biotin carboxyl carrier protein n=1 Tax=Fluviispira vulneris TaxID=2763012 RepID=UPI0016492F70|nr:acetyl-CoA carboxylase biotin carboxyl carrier protein [Fluviispira vulneris]